MSLCTQDDTVLHYAASDANQLFLVLNEELKFFFGLVKQEQSVLSS